MCVVVDIIGKFIGKEGLIGTERIIIVKGTTIIMCLFWGSRCVDAVVLLRVHMKTFVFSYNFRLIIGDALFLEVVELPVDK